ncbi:MULTISPECIES: PHP domain-containing protein [Caldisericum]|uniref:PHP domain-containing protein n=1 Tax=Caldisericum TaxID=693074 RepID=UPI003C75C5CD
MNNYKIAKELLEIKTLLEISGNTKGAYAFEHSALSILALESSLTKYANLNFLPESVKEEVLNLESLGYSPLKETLEAKTPKVLKQIASIPGIRVNDVLKIYNFLNIDSLSDLEKAIKNGKVKKIFSDKFEEHLRRAIFYYESSTKELSLFYASSYANSIVLACDGLGNIGIVGSVRRGKEVVNNIDFVYDFDEETLIETINLNFDILNFEKRGNLIKFKDVDGVILKFFKIPKDYFYAGLQYYTGSKQHNKEIQEIAKTKGFDISKSGYILIKANSEEDFYEKLSLQYVPPELREGEEEIELSITHSLPKLITLSDIKGDLHVHSSFSDGLSTISELHEEAGLLDYEYLAITDHSKGLKIANGVSQKLYLKESELIDRINNEKYSPYLLKGIEAEINFDGSVDVDEIILNKLDLALGGLHQFSNTRFENTERVKKAIKSGIINIMAHPTNRIIFVRKSIDVNIEEIFNTASQFGVSLEVNVFPNRMDLSTGLIKEARRAHVKFFSIGTDAHNRGHLYFMKYGIKILRRAWVKREEVLNTYRLEEIRDLLCVKTH